jgi:hypothetical protein
MLSLPRVVYRLCRDGGTGKTAHPGIQTDLITWSLPFYPSIEHRQMFILSKYITSLFQKSSHVPFFSFLTLTPHLISSAPGLPGRPGAK